MEPANGSLGPKESIEMKVTLVGNIYPSIYEGEMECRVMWTDGEKKSAMASEAGQKKIGTEDGSSNKTPRDSVMRKKGQDKQTYKKVETLFMRMKKRSRINVDSCYEGS